MIRTDLRRIAQTQRLAVDEANLATLTEVSSRLLEDCWRLQELAAQMPAPAHVDRIGHRPANHENPANGWVWKCEIQGSDQGPLAGRTVALKDNIALAGAPLLNGSELMDGFIPSRDATVVTRLLEAGATITGKTAVPAFCCEGAGIFGYPKPLPVNPFDPSRLPGGSSSGSGVVVANGEVDLALGCDQGGSIRIPASWCGCCGLKPSFGLVPYTGIVPVELTLDVVGPMAPTVRGCAEALAVLAGADGLDPRQVNAPVQDYVAALSPRLRPLRLGLLSEGFEIEGASEPVVDARVHRIADALQAVGHDIVRVSLPMHADGVTIWNGITMQGLTNLFRDDGIGTNWKGDYWSEYAAWMHALRKRRSAELPDTVKATLIAGEYMSCHFGIALYGATQNLARALRAGYDHLLDGLDAILMPTTPMQAPPLPDEMSAEDQLQLAIGLNMSNNVAPFNVTGHPSLSVPVQAAGTLPMGMLVVGRRFDDATVLHVGAQVEEVVANDH